MAKKDTKKTKKEQSQPIVDIETVMTEDIEEKSVKEDVKEINEEASISESVKIDILEKRSIESVDTVDTVDTVVTLNGDNDIKVIEESTDNDIQQNEEVKENIENKQNKEIEPTKEAVKKKRVTTNEMFGYNWMGQIYDI